MGDLFSQMIKTTGDAERESGEPITWGEVDYDKLRSSRISNPSVTSWDAPNRDDNASIKVNDSKGGVGGMIFPSTSEVRQSLLADIPKTSYSIDPYTGFSDAFMSQEIRQQPSSSETFASPISQPLPSSSSSGFDGQNTDLGNVAYPDSEENDKKNNNVGQIL
jgi:hypothetical protein